MALSDERFCFIDYDVGSTTATAIGRDIDASMVVIRSDAGDGMNIKSDFRIKSCLPSNRINLSHAFET